MGVPTLDGDTYFGGHLLPPVLTWLGDTYLGQGVPTLGYPLPRSDLVGATYLGQGVPTLGYPSPILTWLGVPTLEGYLPWLGYPLPHPPGVDRQTPVETVPSRRTTYASGNKQQTINLSLAVCSLF